MWGGDFVSFWRNEPYLVIFSPRPVQMCRGLIQLEQIRHFGFKRQEKGIIIAKTPKFPDHALSLQLPYVTVLPEPDRRDDTQWRPQKRCAA